mgnify:CR=1 FL=1
MGMEQYCALVVDDEAAMCTLYEMVLSKVGFNVQYATDGEQALVLLKRQTPDVMFLDMLLPKLDGREVLDYRNTVSHLRHMPVVIVSAHTYFRHQLRLGPNDSFLGKPVRPQQIRDAALAAVRHHV